MGTASASVNISGDIEIYGEVHFSRPGLCTELGEKLGQVGRSWRLGEGMVEGIAYQDSTGSLKRQGGKGREREKGGRDWFHNGRAVDVQLCAAVWKRLEQRERAYRRERRGRTRGVLCVRGRQSFSSHFFGPWDNKNYSRKTGPKTLSLGQIIGRIVY